MGILPYENFTAAVTELTRTLDNQTLDTDIDGFPKVDPKEYYALITILSVLVIMAIVFAIYGLLIKAEAHKHSDHLDNGRNLLFIGHDDSMFGTGLDDF